jgi:hypothetical protein
MNWLYGIITVYYKYKVRRINSWLAPSQIHQERLVL